MHPGREPSTAAEVTGERLADRGQVDQRSSVRVDAPGLSSCVGASRLDHREHAGAEDVLVGAAPVAVDEPLANSKGLMEMPHR